MAGYDPQPRRTAALNCLHSHLCSHLTEQHTAVQQSHRVVQHAARPLVEVRKSARVVGEILAEDPRPLKLVRDCNVLQTRPMLEI